MYRCRVCKRKAKGPMNLLACPDCGGEVLPITYGKTDARGRRVR